MADVWDSATGSRAFTPAEQAQHDADRENAVAFTREARRAAFKEEATSRIKALVGTDKEGEAYTLHLINLDSYSAQLSRKEHRGLASTEEIATLDQLDVMRDGITALRGAENVASAALDSAGLDTNMTIEQRIAQINAVTPVWPV